VGTVFEVEKDHLVLFSLPEVEAVNLLARVRRPQRRRRNDDTTFCRWCLLQFLDPSWMEVAAISPHRKKGIFSTNFWLRIFLSRLPKHYTPRPLYSCTSPQFYLLKGSDHVVSTYYSVNCLLTWPFFCRNTTPSEYCCSFADTRLVYFFTHNP
jgi:hypothetical protein